MENIRENITLAVIAAVYLLCSLRYLPGDPVATMIETANHLLVIAPFLIGAILIFRSLYVKSSGETPGWQKIARIYLTLGIITEFFLGLYNYLDMNKPG